MVAHEVEQRPQAGLPAEMAVRPEEVDRRQRAELQLVRPHAARFLLPQHRPLQPMQARHWQHSITSARESRKACPFNRGLRIS